MIVYITNHYRERICLVYPLLKRDDWGLPLSRDHLCPETTVECLQSGKKLWRGIVVPKRKLNEGVMYTPICIC